MKNKAIGGVFILLMVFTMFNNINNNTAAPDNDCEKTQENAYRILMIFNSILKNAQERGADADQIATLAGIYHDMKVMWTERINEACT